MSRHTPVNPNTNPVTKSRNVGYIHKHTAHIAACSNPRLYYFGRLNAEFQLKDCQAIFPHFNLFAVSCPVGLHTQAFSECLHGLKHVSFNEIVENLLQ